MLGVVVGTFRAEPSRTGQWINHNNQPFDKRLFFYWIGNWKKETPVLEAGHIPGFTSNRILYDRGCCAPACHCLQSLFRAFGYKKSLQKAAYAKRRGAWSFVKSETDLTAMQWESCCVPAYLLFYASFCCIIPQMCGECTFFSHSSVYVNGWIPVLSLLNKLFVAVSQLFL